MVLGNVWCWGVGGVGALGDLIHGLRGWGGVMSVCVVSLNYLWRWHVHASVYCVRRISAHLMRTQCSIPLHLIDICFLTCICLWQVWRMQTFLSFVVVPGLVMTSSAYMRSSHIFIYIYKGGIDTPFAQRNARPL